MTLLLLAGCGAFGGAGGVRIHHPELMPFEIGKIASTVWAEMPGSDPGDGDGEAWVLLTTSVTTCAELEATVGEGYGYGLWDADSVFSQSTGLVLLLAWYHQDDFDAGFEGLYGLGSSVESEEGRLERAAQLLMFDHGEFVYTGTTRGWVTIDEVSGAEARGEVDTELVDADFTAENCGRFEGAP